MRILLCLILFILGMQTAFSIPVWVENNCTLDRNISIIKADETSGSLKIKSFRSDDSGDEYYFEADLQDDTNNGNHHDVYPHHLDATFPMQTDRRFWLGYLLQSPNFPPCPFYQSIESILNTPPPQA